MKGKERIRKQLVPKFVALIAVMFALGFGTIQCSTRSTPTAPPKESAPMIPTISPDAAADNGHIIYSQMDDASWWSIEPDGRNPYQIDIPLDVYAVQTNPNRTLVFFQSRNTFVVNSDPGDVLLMDLPLSFAAVWSPNGQEAIWGDVMNPSPSVVLENFATGESIELTPGRNYLGSRFSPNGEWLAYPSSEGVYLAGPDRKDQRLVSDGATIVGFTPESDRFVYIFRDDDTAVLNIEDLDGGNRRELLRAKRLGGAEVLPDKRVVLVEGTETVSVQAIDLDTGSQIWASTDPQLSGRRNEGVSPNGKLFILGYTPVEEFPTFHVMDVASGEESCVIDPQARTRYDMKFSVDGLYASFTSSGISAIAVNLKTCQLMRPPTQQEAADTSEQYQTSPLVGYTEWAPHATQLLFVVGEPGKEMRLFLHDSNSNDFQELVSGLYVNGSFSPNGDKIAVAITKEGENQASRSSIYLIDVDSLDSALFLDDARFVAWVR